MANRYTYQFAGNFKPKMHCIEAFVSVGTGGMPNSQVQSASGTGSGTYWAPQPGCATAGAPTGWQGTFSGVQGGYGAGIAAVARIATGLYSIQLSDDWARLDSVQVTPLLGSTGATGLCVYVADHTVGLGNSQATGTIGLGPFGSKAKGQIMIQFHAAGPGVDLPLGAGFFVDIRVRDSLAGVQ